MTDAHLLLERRTAFDEILARGKADDTVYELRSRLRLLLGDCEGGWRDVLRSFERIPVEILNYAGGPELAPRGPAPPPPDLDRFLDPDAVPVWTLVEALDKEISRRPRLASAWVWRAALKRRHSDFVGAISDFNRAEELGMRTSAILTWRGEAKIQVLDFRGGRKDLTDALKLPCGAWNHAWCGRALFTLCHDPGAMKYLDRAVALAPRYSYYYAWRGLAKLQLGRPDEEILDDFRKARILDHDRRFTAEISCWRGQTYLRMGRCARALSDFDRAIKIRPDYPVAIHSKAQALRKLGRLDKWIEALDQAAHIRVKHVQSSYAKTEDELRSMVSDLDAVLKDCPGHGVARRWRGLLLARLGRHPEARADLDGVVRDAADDPWGWLWRGELFARTGETQAALRDMNRSLRLAPDNTLALAARAKVWLALGKFGQALRDLDAAAREDPLWAAVFADRGALKLLLKRPREAVSDLEYAVGRDGRDVNARVDLVLALELLGDVSSARRHLRDALSRGRVQTRRRLVSWRIHGKICGKAFPAGLRAVLGDAG
ncbi:MAG: tetratricopeptide repeat protein [Elusimicrobiota bacterium]